MALSVFSFWYNLKNRVSLILRTYWRYLPNRWYFLGLIVLQIILWFWAYRIYQLIGAEVFVSHYNVDFGIDGIGNASRIFQIPGLALIIALINLFFLMSFGHKESFHFLAHASGLGSVLVHFLAFLSIMSLYLINFIA